MTVPTPPRHTDGSHTAEFLQFADAVAGQYELEREIGRGGMGIVYVARDVRLDRMVALKTLPPHLSADPLVRERFLREARTAGALSHANIVPIHRADELRGQVFFVMGYVQGPSLAQRIRDLGRIPALEAVRALRDVADALGYAHSRGVIHRDVKAENILLDAVTGRAMVSDFGIARMADAAPLTSTGQVLGTVYYLSPEQVTGEGVDERSDIYAVGVVAYYALAGRFPFNAQLASAVLVSHVTKTPPPLRDIAPATPRALADIVEKCMSKTPAERFQTCFELRDALSAIEGAVAAADAPHTHPHEPLASTLVSDTEAHSILGRAADLQAATGIQPRLPPIAASRDVRRDQAITSGHRPANLRDAAIEAGISSEYVDHALAEHGLGANAAPRGPAVAALPNVPSAGTIEIADRSGPVSRLAGGRTNIEYEIVVDGEMSIGDFDMLPDTIRRATGDHGQLAVVGRSFSWTSQAQQRRIRVDVLPRRGKTTIRISESMTALAGGLFGGIIGGIGGGGTPLWVAVGVAMHSPIYVALTIPAWLFISYAGARSAFAWSSNKRAEKLRALAEALAVQIKELIVPSA